MNVLYIDPGYARTGWAVIQDTTDHIVELGLIETVKRGRARKSDDTCDRCGQIAAAIAAQVKQYGIGRIAWEVPPGGAKSASALAALARITGVVAATIQLLAVPDTRYTPQAVKAGACGSHTAKKHEVEAAVLKRWPAAVHKMPRAKARKEHICDALAVRMADTAGKVFMQSAECAVPPAGWRCTRAAGHAGPCAAVPA